MYVLVYKCMVRLKVFTVDLRSTVHFHDVALLFPPLLICFVIMVIISFLSSPILTILIVISSSALIKLANVAIIWLKASFLVLQG